MGADTPRPDHRVLIRAHTLDQRRRGLQESTIDVRRRMVGHLAEHLAEMNGRHLEEATVEDIEQFLDARKLARKTRYSYISNLHVFYQWAAHAGFVEKDPTELMVRPKYRQGLPRPISTADLELALNMASGPDVRVIIALGAYQGMRCIEIGRLTREDVLDQDGDKMIIARGKGDRPRVIPLHPQAEAALKALPMPKSGPVLHWGDGRELPAWKISQLGNDYLHAIGLDATMHRLRHWFGTTLYKTSGRDLLLVRDLMGHSSITTTTVYAAFDRAGAVDAVRLLSARKADISPHYPQAG